MAGPKKRSKPSEGSSSQSWQDVWLKAVALSWHDEKFKAALIKDVAKALYDQFGYIVPAGIRIKVKEVGKGWNPDTRTWDAAALNMTGTLELPLPPKPENLRDEALALSYFTGTWPGLRICL